MSLNLKSNNYQSNIKEAKFNDSLVYRFEGFRLDAAHLMLTRNDEEISMRSKVVETLLALVERRGEIVRGTAAALIMTAVTYGLPDIKRYIKISRV